MKNNILDRYKIERIYTADTLEESSKARAARQGQKGVNMGNSLVLDYTNFPNQNIPVADPAQWFQDGKWEVVAGQRILTGRILDLPKEQQGPANWVITLKAEILDLGPDIFGGVPCIGSQLVAKVTYGTGGVSSSFEVDAWRSIFSIPATDFEIEVGWSTPGTDETADGVAQIPTRVPMKTRVTATAHRSLETGEGIPTRSFWLIPSLGGAGANFTRSVPIPPQAVSWCVSTPVSPAATDQPLTTTQLTTIRTPFSAIVADGVNPDVLNAMIRGRCFREAPTYARQWESQINSGVYPALTYALLEFRLGV